MNQKSAKVSIYYIQMLMLSDIDIMDLGLKDLEEAGTSICAILGVHVDSSVMEGRGVEEE